MLIIINIRSSFIDALKNCFITEIYSSLFCISNDEINYKISKENDENRVGEDTVTILLSLPATISKDFKLEYIQCPSGSWSYNSINNNSKRDEIRPDVIIKSIDDRIISISSKKDIRDLNKKEKDRKYNTDFLIYAVSSRKIENIDLLENEALIVLDLDEGVELIYFTDNEELSNIINKLYSNKFQVKRLNKVIN
jgi:hypothetical protein